MQKPVVTLQDIYFKYEKKTILNKINLTIQEGSYTGLIGPNGGGKTTLIKLILGLLKPNDGDISILNEPLSNFKNWNQIGFVSQKSNAFNKGFPATVYEVVAMGLTAKIGYFKFFTKKDKDKVLHAISQVGMEEFTHQNIGKLSGGQQQRVFIARALVSDPTLLILDEPTVGIDYKNENHFYKLLNHLNKNHQITLLLVTHDTKRIAKYATEIVCLNETIRFHGSPEAYRSLSELELARMYQQITHHLHN